MHPYPEFVTAVHLAGALVFFFAALAKLRQLPTFEGVVANYRLLPAWLVRPFAFLLPPAEMLLSLALLAGVRNSDFAGSALLLVFALAMGINILRGRAHIDCGCFNSALRQPLRWALVIRNAALALLLALAANAGAPSLDHTLALGAMGGIAIFVVIQALNAVLAIPALKRRHVPG